MEDLRDIDNLVAALALHPLPVRRRMLNKLIGPKVEDAGLLHRRALFMTRLREREVWPNSGR